MALLRPWVGKEEVDRGEAFVRDHALQHLDGVVPDHSQIVQAERLDPVEEAADPGPWTSTAMKSASGCAWAMAAVVSPMPEPISSTSGAVLPNVVAARDAARPEGYAVLRKQLFKRALLRRGGAALPSRRSCESAASTSAVCEPRLKQPWARSSLRWASSAPPNRASSACARRDKLRGRPRPPCASPPPSAPDRAPRRWPCS